MSLRVTLPLVVILFVAAVAPQQQVRQPVLHVDGLPEDRLFVGTVTLTARVEPALPIDWVDFSVDGEVRCHVPASPFVCPLRLSPNPQGYQVVVTAVLTTGEKVDARFVAVTVTDSSAVSAVSVPIVVMDQRNEPIAGLTKDDFQVMDDGVPRALDFCQAEEVPLDLVLAVDVSDSMRRSLPEIQNAFGRFLRSFTGELKVTLVAFNAGLYVVRREDPDIDSLVQAVDRLAASGGTALYDAVYDAMGYLGSNLGWAPALVVFTDGDDNGSRATLAGLHERLAEVEGAVYLIVRETRQTDDQMLRDLRQFAESSGGELMLMETVGDLREYLQTIARRLTSLYLCGFTLDETPDGRRHELDVQLPRLRDVIVQARDFYVARVR